MSSNLTMDEKWYMSLLNSVTFFASGKFPPLKEMGTLWKRVRMGHAT